MPKAALLSHVNSALDAATDSGKMYDALKIIKTRDPDLEIDGQMRADAALMESIRDAVLPGNRLRGSANLLIMPNLDAAKIAYDLIKMLGEGTTIGPVLLGLRQPVHIMTSSSTVRRILDASALAVVDAQIVGQGSGREQVVQDRPVRHTG
jgi:Phosphotransacetylase